MVEKYSGLHSTCKEVKEQSPDEVRNRALSGALRYVVDKGVGVKKAGKAICSGSGD